MVQIPEELLFENLEKVEIQLSQDPTNEANWDAETQKIWNFCDAAVSQDGPTFFKDNHTILHYMAVYLLPLTLSRVSELARDRCPGLFKCTDASGRTPMYCIVTAQDKYDPNRQQRSLSAGNLLSAVGNGQLRREIVNYFDTAKGLISPLHYCLDNDLECLTYLGEWIDFSYELPNKGTWLHAACLKPRETTSLLKFVDQILLQREQEDGFVNAKNGQNKDEGYPAIYLAVKNRLSNIVAKILLQGNAIVSDKLKHNRTVVHTAAIGGRTTAGAECFRHIFKYVMTSHTIPDKIELLFRQDSDEKSVLQYASQFCPAEVVESCIDLQFLNQFPEDPNTICLTDTRMELIYETPQVLEYILNHCFTYSRQDGSIDGECDLLCDTRFITGEGSVLPITRLITGDEPDLPNIHYLYWGIQKWSYTEQEKILKHPAVQVYIFERNKRANIHRSVSILVMIQVLWLLSLSTLALNNFATGYTHRGGYSLLCSLFVILYAFWTSILCLYQMYEDSRSDKQETTWFQWSSMVTKVTLVVFGLLLWIGIGDSVLIYYCTLAAFAPYLVTLIGRLVQVCFEAEGVVGVTITGLMEIIWCIAAASLAFNTFYPIPRTTTVITGTFCGIYVVFSLIYELLEGYAIGATQYYSRIENIFQILRNIVFLVAMGHMIFLEEGDVNYNTSIVRIFGGATILISYCLSMRHFRNVAVGTGQAIEILKQVLIRIFRVFASCSFLLIGFTMAFLVVYSPNGDDSPTANNSTDSNSTYLMDSLNVSYTGAFLKPLVLMTGELQYSDLSKNLDPLTTSKTAKMEALARQVLFLVFIIGVLLAYFNQLTGVAIEGVREIHNQADTSRLARKVEYIYFVESLWKAARQLGITLPKGWVIGWEPKDKIVIAEPFKGSRGSKGWKAFMERQLCANEPIPKKCYLEMYKLAEDREKEKPIKKECICCK